MIYILQHIEVCKGVAGGVRVDQLGQVHHQLFLGIQLGRKAKRRRFWVFDLSKTIIMDILHPSLNLPIFGDIFIRVIEDIDKGFDVFQRDVPQHDCVISVVEAGQVHHVSLLQMVGIVHVIKGEVFESFGKKLLDSCRTEACGEADVTGTSWSNEHFTSSSVHSDDELHVLLQQLEDRVGS